MSWSSSLADTYNLDAPSCELLSIVWLHQWRAVFPFRKVVSNLLLIVWKFLNCASLDSLEPSSSFDPLTRPWKHSLVSSPDPNLSWTFHEHRLLRSRRSYDCVVQYCYFHHDLRMRNLNRNDFLRLKKIRAKDCELGSEIFLKRKSWVSVKNIKEENERDRTEREREKGKESEKNE